MEKIEGINLKELVEECEIALKKEKEAKEKYWQSYWKLETEQAALDSVKYRWMRPY